MKQFTTSEVPLRGRGFNFYPACDKLNVSSEIAEEVLWAMHISARVVGKDGVSNEEQRKIRDSNPILPNTFGKEHFLDENYVEKCIEAGLIEKMDEQYTITEKMASILEETVKLRGELANTGIPCCCLNC